MSVCMTDLSRNHSPVIVDTSGLGGCIHRGRRLFRYPHFNDDMTVLNYYIKPTIFTVTNQFVFAVEDYFLVPWEILKERLGPSYTGLIFRARSAAIGSIIGVTP